MSVTPFDEPPSAAPQGWFAGVLLIVLMGLLLAVGQC